MKAFFQADPESHRATMTWATEQGMPVPPALAKQDLIYLDNQVKRGELDSFPSYSELSRRWGWGWKPVKKLTTTIFSTESDRFCEESQKAVLGTVITRGGRKTGEERAKSGRDKGEDGANTDKSQKKKRKVTPPALPQRKAVKSANTPPDDDSNGSIQAMSFGRTTGEDKAKSGRDKGEEWARKAALYTRARKKKEERRKKNFTPEAGWEWLHGVFGYPPDMLPVLAKGLISLFSGRHTFS